MVDFWGAGNIFYKLNVNANDYVNFQKGQRKQFGKLPYTCHPVTKLPTYGLCDLISITQIPPPTT